MEKQNTPPKTDTFSDSIREFGVSSGSIENTPVHKPIVDVSAPNALDESPVYKPQDDWSHAPRSGLQWRKVIGFGVLTFAVIFGLILMSRYGGGNTPADVNTGLTATSAKLKSQSTSLLSLSSQLGSSPAQSTGTLTVNGNLSVGNTLFIQPTAKPAHPTPGQLYYDKGTNQMEYYDGKGFVTVGSSSVTNNYTTVGGTVTNVTNLTQVSNAVSGGASSTSNGTPGTLAMFGGSNTLQDSLIKESGNTLTTSADAFQGNNSQGMSIVTADSAGASGALILQSGASSTTSSGDVTLDTGSGIVNGTVIEDYTFEDGVDGWDGTPYYTNPVQSNAFAHSGSYSLAVPLSLVSWSSASIEGLTVIPGHEYQWSAWLRAGTAPSPIGVIVYYDNGGNPQPPAVATSDSAGSWTHFTDSFVVPNGTTEMNLTFIYQKNAIETHYIDDVTLTDLNSFSGLTVNVGTANAQAVNIGNSGQVGDTTITGGTTGVKINDATGNVDINAGASAIVNGGKVVLSDVGGSGNGVFVEPENDSTTAFQVQAANGGALLTADSVAGDIDIGPAASAARLSVAGSTSDSTSSAETVTDAAGSQLFNIRDDGQVSIGRSDASDTFGETEIGPNTDSGSVNLLIGDKFTTSTAMSIESMSVYIDNVDTSDPGTDGINPANAYQVGIYTDNAGNPDTYVASSSIGLMSQGWNTISVSASLSANTTYWLVFTSNSTNNGFGVNTSPYFTGIQSHFYAPFTFGSGPNAGMPATVTGYNLENTTQSIFATSTNGLPAFTINSLGDLNQSGGATFEDPTNSTTAFQVQNSSGNPVLTADTINNAIVLGQDNTPTDITVRGGAASGTNVAGANVTFDASDGTGYGGSGSFIFRTAGSQGAIGVDNSGSEIGGLNGVATLSYTTGTQSDRLMVVTALSSNSYTSITYDGINLTQLATNYHSADVEMWYLLNPPSGTYNIVAHTVMPWGMLIGATTFYDVDQSTPFGTVATSFGSTTSPQPSSLNVTTTSPSQIVIDGIGTDGDDPVVNAGQTQAWNEPPTGGNWPAGGSYAPGTGGTVNMSWTVDDSDWADIGVPINPDTTGSGTVADGLKDSLVITNNGNIGVDTASPQYALDVNGVINTSSAVYSPLIDVANGSLESLNIGTSNASSITIGNPSNNILTTISGTAVIRPTPGNDSTTAFQVQDSNSTPLFTADTTDMSITVGGTLTVSGDVTLDGHVVTGGTTPNIAGGSAACTSPTVNVTGSDTAGQITVTTGTGCSAGGTLANISFANDFASAPYVVISPVGGTAASLNGYVDSTSLSDSGFSIDSSTVPANSTTYTWDYWAAQ